MEEANTLGERTLMNAVLFDNRRRLWTLLLGATLTCAGSTLAGDERSPEALRDQARALQQEIRELREAGHHDEAERLQNNLRELREDAERMQRERRRQNFDRPLPPEEVREREAMMRHLRELMAAGRREEAAELRRELARRQREMNRGAERPGPEGRLDAPAEREELGRRLEHLQIAIENLHAAGLHDLAERLNQQSMVQRERLERRAPPRAPEPPIGELREELGRVRAELEEVRAQLGELRRHIRELHRDQEGH
jgi:hypothetical protein